MKIPNLGSHCCMPKPKMMRISQTLRGRLQCILARGLFQKNKNKNKNKMMNKNEKPIGDEYIVSPCLRQRVENF